MKLVQKRNSTTIIQNEITITGSNMRIPEDFNNLSTNSKNQTSFFLKLFNDFHQNFVQNLEHNQSATMALF